MEITAKLKYLRIAPRKVGAVLDLIRGLDIDSAKTQLMFLPKRATQPILKLLNSAVANALSNYSIRKEDLYIKKIFTDKGPTLYRWTPRAFGRATPIRKKSSHLTIVLGTKKEILPKKKEEKEEKVLEIKEEKPKISEKKKEEIEKAKDDLRLKRRESFIKRIFRRKTI